MLLKAIPPVLVEQHLQGRLVLFVGAGTSIGSGLPSGKGLAFQLQTELFKNQHLNTKPSPDDPLQLEIVAQRYQLAFGRQKLNEVLLQEFQKEGLKPNAAHKLAVGLFRRIATTNFDTLLEEALREDGKAPIVVVRDAQIPTTSLPGRTVIYKLHGDIATPERIVITHRDYQKVPLTEGMETELKSLLLKNSILFVGYSLSDPDFSRVIELCRSILGQAIPKSYVVVPGAEKDALFVKQCEEDDIDVFSDTALDFLHDLEEAIRQHREQAVIQPSVPVQTLASEEEEGYRATVCDEFKWIDFKGIPVLGGYLRVQIDQLFVSLSAMSREDREPAGTVRGRETHHGSPNSKKQSFLGAVGTSQSIFEILKDTPKLVVLGDPGSGKTTFLRYVGYHLSLPDPQPSRIGLDKPYVPIFVPLREYSAFVKSAATSEKKIQDFLPQLLKIHNLEKYVPVLKAALERGDAILLLDGLDEVASEEERLQVATSVQLFSSSYPACRLVLTSRRVGYPRAPIRDGFSHFVVEPLSDKEVETFIDLWCRATEPEAEKRKAEKQNLFEAVKNPRVRALAGNPLLVTILARVYKAYRNLPERRAELYAKCVEALLTTWDLMRDLPPVFQDAREANRILGPIALWIHRDCQGQLVSKDQLLAKLTEIPNLPRGQSPTVVLTQIEERSGLFRQVGLNQYAFTHLTFQEYYAARQIVSTGNCFRQLRRFLRNSRWEEVIILTAGLLDDLGTKAVSEFLENFLVKPSFPTGPRPLQNAKLNLLLACLTDKVEPEPHIGEYVRRTLLAASEAQEHRRLLLARLGGFGKTKIGGMVLQELKERLKSERNDVVARNVILLGYDLNKEAPDQIEYLMFALAKADPKLKFLANAAAAVCNLLKGVVGPTASNVMKEIRTMNFDRRLQITTLLRTATFDDKLIRETVELWTSPEERVSLPPELRPKR